MNLTAVDSYMHELERQFDRLKEAMQMGSDSKFVKMRATAVLDSPKA